MILIFVLGWVYAQSLVSFRLLQKTVLVPALEGQ